MNLVENFTPDVAPETEVLNDVTGKTRWHFLFLRHKESLEIRPPDVLSDKDIHDPFHNVLKKLCTECARGLYNMLKA